MINFIEAAHYKISCAMADVDCRPKPASRFQQFIERTKDKQVLVPLVEMMPTFVTWQLLLANAALM